MARGARSEDIPPADDPIWQSWGETVLGVLSKRRNLEQLKSWAREESFEVGKLVNSLAWLDLKGLVKTEQVRGEVTWVRSLPKARPPPQPMPNACPRCAGKMRPEPERLVCITCGRSIYPPVEPD